MIYTNFSERLNRYLHIYERGLKKQANAEISAIVKHIHGLPRNEQDYIIFKFLSDYCDKDIWDS